MEEGEGKGIIGIRLGFFLTSLSSLPLLTWFRLKGVNLMISYMGLNFALLQSPGKYFQIYIPIIYSKSTKSVFSGETWLS